MSNLAGYVIVSTLAQEFALLEIRDRSAPARSDRIVWSDLVPAERHMVTFAPGPRAAVVDTPADSSWPIIRVDRPDRVLSHLPEFLGSPESAGQALRQRLPLRRPMAVMIANGGLVVRDFPDDPAVTGRLMRVQKEFGLSIVLAADLTPRRDYSAFDFVTEVLPPTAGWGSTRVRCVRAPVGAEVRVGDEFTLGQLEGSGPSIERVEAAIPSMPPEP